MFTHKINERIPYSRRHHSIPQKWVSYSVSDKLRRILWCKEWILSCEILTVLSPVNIWHNRYSSRVTSDLCRGQETVRDEILWRYSEFRREKVYRGGQKTSIEVYDEKIPSLRRTVKLYRRSERKVSSRFFLIIRKTNERKNDRAGGSVLIALVTLGSLTEMTSLPWSKSTWAVKEKVLSNRWSTPDPRQWRPFFGRVIEIPWILTIRPIRVLWIGGCRSPMIVLYSSGWADSL